MLNVFRATVKSLKHFPVPLRAVCEAGGTEARKPESKLVQAAPGQGDLRALGSRRDRQAVLGGWGAGLELSVQPI